MWSCGHSVEGQQQLSRMLDSIHPSSALQPDVPVVPIDPSVTHATTWNMLFYFRHYFEIT